MTININELRRLAQAALIGPDGVSMRWLKLLKDFQEEANPSEVLELLDRLEAAEKERDALCAEVNVWRRQAEAYWAKIEQMERQEPVAWARKLGMDLPSFGCVTDLKYRPSDMPESAYMPLYAPPCAQGE